MFVDTRDTRHHPGLNVIKRRARSGFLNASRNALNKMHQCARYQYLHRSKCALKTFGPASYVYCVFDSDLAVDVGRCVILESTCDDSSSHLQIPLLLYWCCIPASEDCILSDHTAPQSTLQLCTQCICEELVTLLAAHHVSLLLKALVLHSLKCGRPGFDLCGTGISRPSRRL